MFQPPERDETDKPYVRISTKQQLAQIEAIKPPSLEEVRKKYLEPLYAKLGPSKPTEPAKSLDERLEEMGF